MTPDPTRFVLIDTSHAGNVGAAARAMKVMGFSTTSCWWRRAGPTCCSARRRSRWPAARPTCWQARASSPRSDEALDGVTYVVRDGDDAARLRPADLRAARALRRPGRRRRIASPSCSARSASACRNDDVYRCHACLTHPDRSALRLAQPRRGGAADRLRLAPGAGRLRGRGARADAGAWPTRVAVRGMLAHWQQALTAIGFLDPAAPKKLMPRLHQLFNRAAADRGGGPHPARHRPSNVEAAIPLNWPTRVIPRDHRHVPAPARRHRLHPRTRSCRAQSTWEVLTCYPGLHALVLHRQAALVAAPRLPLAGALRLAPRALLHRHRDPSRREDRPARLHRPRHGRRRRRDGGDRRRLHHLPGRDARRHLARPRAPSAIRRSAAA